MSAHCYRPLFLCLLLLGLFTPTALYAQDADTSKANDYAAERDLIQSTLGTFVKVIKTASFREDDPSVTQRLESLAQRLNSVNQSLPATPLMAATTEDDSTKALSVVELQNLEDSLDELYGMVRDMRMSMEAENNFELADRLSVVEKGIDSAVVQTRRLLRSGDDASSDNVDREPMPAIADRVEPDEVERPIDEDGDGWLEPGEYRDDVRYSLRSDDDDDDSVRITYHEAIEDVREGIREASDAAYDAHTYSRNRTYYRYREPRSPFDDFSYADAYVGEFYSRWPFRETALYRSIPAIRYNRVEGLVLGARLLPLEWGDWENAKIYGQAGYAFSLKKPRYELGAEIRPFPYLNDNYDFKIGASYRRNTTTNDIWKVNWVENSLASILFEYDYLDYYQVDGISLYAIQRLSPFVQLSLGYRSEEYSSLETTEEWSLFQAGNFRFNPPVAETRLNSFVAAIEGGQLANMYSVPRGWAFRIDAEISEGLENDFQFQRYLGDVRVYVPMGYSSSLGMRLRGGYVSDEAPIQKLFTLGGLGSVRAYPQNVFIGTEMLLGNIEYTIASIAPLDDIFDDIQLFGFADAGWVNGFANQQFDWDDVFSSAGVGLSFADRTLRLELAWPLDDFGGDRDPSLWLRLTPTF